MTTRSADSRRWVSGVLKAARAAAFLTLATGINGTVAALYPRYEPIYVYLLSIVVVSWMSGLFLGVTAAIAAVVLYDWMFSPVRIVPSAASVVPFAVAIAAAVTTRAAHSPMLLRRAIAPSPPPPFLPVIAPQLRPLANPAPVPVAVSVMPRVDTEQIERLEGQIAQLQRQTEELDRQLGVAHAQTEKEVRLRADAAETARSRYTALQHELDSARVEAVENTRRSAAMHAGLDSTSARALESDQKAAALLIANASAAARVLELEERLEDTLQELDTAWRRVDEEKARAEREAELRAKVDQVASEKLKQAAADISARYQAPLAEAKSRLADAFTRLPVLERERDSLLAEVTSMRTASERDRKSAEAFRARVTELEEMLEAAAVEERERRQAMNRDFDARLQSIVTGLTNDQEDAISQSTVDREAARAEARLLNKKVEILQAKLAEHNSQQAELVRVTADLRTASDRERQRADEEVARRGVMAKEFDTKLQTIITGITHDLEETLSEALIEKEAARAEARNLAKKLETAVQQVAEVSAAGTKLQEMFTLERRHLAEQSADHENAISAALLGREGARAEARALADRIETLEKQLRETEAGEGARRQAMATEFDARLQSIVSGLTSDYEQTLAEAMIEREAARAEFRTASGNVESMQRKLVDLDTSIRAHVEKATADLRDELAAERIRADEEKAARMKLEELHGDASRHETMQTEFDAKLQSIVSGLTSDYESTLAEAMIEREAARAEARTASGKVESMQRKLSELDASVRAHVEKATSDLRRAVETERARAGELEAAHRKLDAEWGEKLQSIVNHLASDHEIDLGQAMLEKEAAKAEVRTLSSRLAALQQKLDRERAAFQTTAERPLPPLPLLSEPGEQRRILVVHSDAGTRAMARHTLEESEYSVMTAADGLEGLRMTATHRPDVVIAEAVLPKMNGREMVQLLKSKPETSHMKIILISSQAGELERNADYRADGILPDLSDLDALRATIASVLG